MRKSWTARYPVLSTHDWAESPAKNEENLKCYTCNICGYTVWINSLGFARDHRGVRTKSPNDSRFELYSFYTCNDFVVKNIIE